MSGWRVEAWSNVGAALAVVALLGSVGAFVSASRETAAYSFGAEARLQQDRAQAEALRTRAMIQELAARLQLMGDKGVPSATAVKLDQLRAEIASITARQDRIEGALQNSPEKALMVPMLRKDFEALKESQTQQFEAVRASYDQLYDLLKWVLGAVGLSVISMAINAFAKGRKEAAAD